MKLGSKCVFAICLFSLKDKLRNGYPAERLINIRSDATMERFETDCDGYPLAYLIEEPKDKIEPTKEPEYKSFSSIEKAKKIIDKHGGWVNYKCYSFLVTAYDTQLPEHSIYLNNRWYSFQELYDFFIFADDSSPCGELVEE